ncbi:hypothetical protein FPV67DRAFT_1652323 [Lyophyllum atratum]|nr:hypothetical protein FPV67DRAFT_1652323 [Lyophyllum atratum]
MISLLKITFASLTLLLASGHVLATPAPAPGCGLTATAVDAACNQLCGTATILRETPFLVCKPVCLQVLSLNVAPSNYLREDKGKNNKQGHSKGWARVSRFIATGSGRAPCGWIAKQRFLMATVVPVEARRNSAGIYAQEGARRRLSCGRKAGTKANPMSRVGSVTKRTHPRPNWMVEKERLEMKTPRWSIAGIFVRRRAHPGGCLVDGRRERKQIPSYRRSRVDRSKEDTPNTQLDGIERKE